MAAAGPAARTRGPGGTEHGVASSASRGVKPVDEVAECLDAQPARQERVERRDRLSMQGRVVGQAGTSGHGPAPRDLEVEPRVRFASVSRLGATERGHEPPRRTGRTVSLADVGDLHRSESIGGSTAAGSIVRRSADGPTADEIDR